MERTDSHRLTDEVLAYYQAGREHGRLRAGRDRLELLRTRDILRRLLPPAPARVLDVGGGTGVHAAWLAEDGYDVHLIDPMPLHIERAAELPGVRATIGDARELDAADAAADAVLLLGPLYHLAEPADRALALSEAVRAVRPGGLVAAATINRTSPLHDSLYHGWYQDPALRSMVDTATATGRLVSAGLDAPTGGFDAYLHDPAEILAEFTAAGLPAARQYGIEGAAWLLPTIDTWLDDPERRTTLLDALRGVEEHPHLLGASGHLLTAAFRPRPSAN
ncbi:class I SAM-dependent methyltransferase [Allonocardiopsis opalescens]|uniref:Ubiquinone/menaquinone biosynthesis C-methylase UbiE n=1 Tax=Allonocardiopsis opalescens TaxID=1144618 RepID=A0A2T0Q7I3_9ACTN|nr:methyltransferase domain-containing protein [Allonocardiopsis opalescens]PRX99787.1 ubiquinone/menaquinone biosynthesis C-methylase UbiE [Allonocardiopsis opalescens]